MRQIFFVILVTTLWLPIGSHGISRVGNGGIQSLVSGYTVQVPSEFSNIQFFPSENARLFNLNSAFAAVKSIDLRNFATEFPELNLKTLSEIQQSLLDSGWSLVANQNFCGKIFYQETLTTMAYIAIWGQSKGFVLVTDRTSSSRNYLDNILKTTTLEKGACEW